jgi:hypothetical protein
VSDFASGVVVVVSTDQYTKGKLYRTQLQKLRKDSLVVVFEVDEVRGWLKKSAKAIVHRVELESDTDPEQTQIRELMLLMPSLILEQTDSGTSAHSL